MSAVPKRKLTVAEYLAIENRANYKSEFFDGEMFAMAGASIEHNGAKDNLLISIGAQLKGGPCRTYSSDQRVMVDATGLYTYPDIVILCGPAVRDLADKNTLVNPKVIIEVLSPSTGRYDRGAKFRNYRKIPSLAEYVLAAQDEPVCERFVRQKDGSWKVDSFVGLTETLAFAAVAVSIPLADIYEGIAFPETLDD